jgi:hypothetical protein
MRDFAYYGLALFRPLTALSAEYREEPPWPTVYVGLPKKRFSA